MKARSVSGEIYVNWIKMERDRGTPKLKFVDGQTAAD
jgi:hypothetical protein